MTNGGACTVCEPPREHCYTHCQAPEAEQHAHVLDPDSITLTRNHWGHYSIDGFCEHCGQSGGIPFDPSAIQWE